MASNLTVTDSIIKNNCKLEDMSKEDLISRVHQLEAHVEQLRNSLAKKNRNNNEEKMYFNFKRFKKRHVLLKFLYLGWDYHGFAGQEDGIRTIENEIFRAFQRTKLLDSTKEMKELNYNRCGRTDTGVSAFSQVISVDLRSVLIEGKGIFTPNDYIPPDKITSKVKAEKELPYCKMLNRALPDDIRIYAWAPVDSNVSARFDCKKRTYKYFFAKGNLDIEKMEKAAKYFIGEHDFRNLCKTSVKKNMITNFRRTILNVTLTPVLPSSHGNYQIYELTFVGYAFLWHQIRLIVSILFLIGQNKESPEIVKELLDIEKCPRKPNYHMALDIPLVLFDCEYEDVEWEYDNEVICNSILKLQNFWTHNAIKSTMVKKMIDSLKDKLEPLEACAEYDSKFFLKAETSRNYTPLLQRQCEETIEEKIERASKKIKVNITTG